MKQGAIITVNWNCRVKSTQTFEIQCEHGHWVSTDNMSQDLTSSSFTPKRFQTLSEALSMSFQYTVTELIIVREKRRHHK
jgi:hypothetical protein